MSVGVQAAPCMSYVFCWSDFLFHVPAFAVFTPQFYRFCSRCNSLHPRVTAAASFIERDAYKFGFLFDVAENIKKGIYCCNVSWSFENHIFLQWTCFYLERRFPSQPFSLGLSLIPRRNKRCCFFPWACLYRYLA